MHYLFSSEAKEKKAAIDFHLKHFYVNPKPAKTREFEKVSLRKIRLLILAGVADPLSQFKESPQLQIFLDFAVYAEDNGYFSSFSGHVVDYRTPHAQVLVSGLLIECKKVAPLVSKKFALSFFEKAEVYEDSFCTGDDVYYQYASWNDWWNC